MSPISIGLNLLLATLLGLTLWLGWRLNRRLTALRDGQAQFAAAVADLDRAAARAERGLAQLRAAGDETLELLSGRVEKGRELATRLERLNDTARATLDQAAHLQAQAQAQAQAQVASGPSRAKASLPPAIAALQKVWGEAPSAKSASELSLEEAEAAAESLVLKLSKAEVLEDSPVTSLASRIAAKSRTIVDDDLFETPARPAPRILAGGR
jgi:chromosome segregation ATPase